MSVAAHPGEPGPQTPRGTESCLVVGLGHTFAAVPIAAVVETMRPLPIEPARGAPGYVLGLAIVRGRPVPVIDTAALLGDTTAAPARASTETGALSERFVIVRAAERTVALHVGRVFGLRSIPNDSIAALPTLVASANAGHVASVGVLDGALLHVLAATRLAPSLEGMWTERPASPEVDVPPRAPESSP